MLEQLPELKKRLQKLAKFIADPTVANDIAHYTKLNKEYKELEKLVIVYDKYVKIQEAIEITKVLIADTEDNMLQKMGREELEKLAEQSEILQEEIQALLLPTDPNDEKDCILEIRAGVGGDEAAIWAGDLFRMYQRFAQRQKWQLQIVDYTPSTSSGYKEIISTIKGQEVYKKLKYESGIHRVQRVPQTESKGRLQTSAASVVVLPEVDEVTISLDMNEIRKDTFCSSGPGGQSVNTTYSAVRLTHLPTGVVVTCQDQKSQLQNFEQALEVLRARLYEKALQEQQSRVGATRKAMVGSGDRSQKIRTYNYPGDRVTDHRINYTQKNLSIILDGQLEKLIETLYQADIASKIQEAAGSKD